MRIVLARIDDRFIHGQVIVGWSQSLRPDHIILANNEIAADDWQSRVYTSSVPPGIRVSILGTSEAAAALKGGDGGVPGQGDTILLAGTPRDMHFIHRHGQYLPEVNVGGLHYAQGKREMLSNVYVDREDLEVFRAFIASGTQLVAQQVPGSRETVIDLALIGIVEGRL